MRILIISERYPPNILGGYEIACAAVADGLRLRGHDVAILTSNFRLNQLNAGDNGFRLLHYQESSPSLVRFACQEIADHQTTRRVISGFKPDVLYAWCMLHLFPSLHFILREVDIPVVINIQDTWLPRHLAEAQRLRTIWLNPGSNLARRVGKVIIRTAIKCFHPMFLRPLTVTELPLNYLVFCSRFRMVEHEALGLPSGHSRVIYNGIDTAVFSCVSDREAGLPLRVLFAGRLVAEKGAHTAIEALGHLRRRGCHQVMLSIAGVPAYPWEYASRLQQDVAAQGLEDRVRFLGMVTHDALPEVYRQHDVLVFPSICHEGLPMTLLEAMACGLAVVGTTTGGSSEILQHEVNALTFPPCDSVSFADCLFRLVHEPALVRSLATAGQQMVSERFSIDSLITQTEDFLKEVCSNHSHNFTFACRSSF